MKRMLTTLATSELAHRLESTFSGEGELRERYRGFIESEGMNDEDRRLALDLDGDESGDLARHFLWLGLVLMTLAVGLALWVWLGVEPGPAPPLAESTPARLT